MDSTPESFEFVDRYTATGTPYPDAETVCLGQCEGMGFYPQSVDDQTMTAEERRRVDENIAAGKVDEIGYTFITCPDCEGTGKRPT